MTTASTNHEQRYQQARRRYLLAWVALLVLLAASAASARLHLGVGNLVAGLGIALLKVAIVAWIFMALRESTALLRIAATAGVAALLVLSTLSLVDFVPRHDEATRWQKPQAVPALLAQNHAGAAPAPSIFIPEHTGEPP